jgi:trk system potassium uptake protein TrkA
MKGNTTKDYTIIIGCGRLGASLANILSENKGQVLIIDRNKEAFRKLSPSYEGLTLTGEATDMDVLKDAEIEKATAVIVVTDNDDTNIMISQMVKTLFKKKCVISRLYDPEKECVYSGSGIKTICPVFLSIKEISGILSDLKTAGSESL